MNLDMRKIIMVNDLMQKTYAYFLTEPMEKYFAENFKPQLAPKDMLEFGLFGGKYMIDCKD